MANKMFFKLKQWPLHPVYTGLLVYLLTMLASLYGGVVFQTDIYSPGEDPPLYFVQQDYIEGLFSFGGALLLGLVMIVCYRKQLKEALYWSSIPLCFLINPIVCAANIAFNSSDIFDPTCATITWKTLEDYHGDTFTQFGGIFILIVLLAVVRLFFNPALDEDGGNKN